MNFKEKRKAKTLAKIFFIAAYAMVILFAVIEVGLFAGIPILSTDTPDVIVILASILPLFVGIASGIAGQVYLHERTSYLKNIKRYRQCRFFIQTIKLLHSGNFDTAVDIYQKLVTDKEFRCFLYPMFITYSLFSEDEKRKEVGETRLNNILESYDPEKCFNN
jgi:hypothetical protein